MSNCGSENGLFFPLEARQWFLGQGLSCLTLEPEGYLYLVPYPLCWSTDQWMITKKRKGDLYPSTDTESKNIPPKSHSAQWFAIILRVKQELGREIQLVKASAVCWSSRTGPCWEKGTQPQGDRATLNLFLHCPLPHPAPPLSET